ncbi:DUF2303 family protein [Terrihabitans sp. B22-R8]|uniref:DUF2303 family protein n=1 Tax=Terrihabitans sp. B22-R8 TaxID=3425128 RepID=UPI00403C2B8D
MSTMANPNSTGIQPDQTSLTANAVGIIADLAEKASEAEVLHIPAVGLGDGLPTMVPALFDRKTGSAKSLLPLIEEARQEPERRKGTATTTTLASFIDLINRHKDEGSAVFGQTAWPNPRLTAVIDYHTLDHTPRWGRHRISYAFPVTDELKAWVDGNGKAMEQAEFAAFLEEHAAELASPFDAEKIDLERLFKANFATPNELIDLSRSLEVFVGARVKRQERLQTGERTIEFAEEHTNGNGEKVTIPGIFMLSVPAFVDGAAVRIPARLRYRIAGGSVVWFYQLYRWEFWLREQVVSDLDRVADETELPTFEGSPEA